MLIRESHVLCICFLKAGIENGQLSLALEPEAAAILCKEISTQRDRQDTDSVVLTSFRPGTKFFILDLGGRLYN